MSRTKREKKLSWKVLRYDWNKRKVVNSEIFSDDFIEILKRDRKRKKFTDYNSLKDYLKRDFQYHYWSKSECEIMIGSLGEDDIDKFEKIDMYRQIEMNLDRITEYVIDVMQFRF